MARGMTDDKYYKEIADELRKVNGDSDDIKYLPADMKSMVKWSCEVARNGGYYDGHEAGLKTGREQGESEGYAEGLAAGKSEGYAEGFATGKAEGYAEGLAAGKVAEYDNFWDNYQANGNRTAYNYGFAYWGWTDETYKPKYKPMPSNASYMYNNTRITDTKIDVDFSNATNMTYTFVGAYYVKNIGVVDTRSAKNSITQLFAYCRALQTIDKLILLDDGSQTFLNVFLENNALQNIVIEGVIGNSISFQHSPLSAKSLVSVVEHLSDTATGKTATFKQTATDNADWSTTEYSSWDELIATKPNWAFSLV